ncbi:MAG TPA: cation:proton antiporter [Rhodocyclaceae bacterium]|jgi:Kef-type K+ transport system membrane component KefB|nr:cation:proton antiporter [Rhodocyclaceae bacterium]
MLQPIWGDIAIPFTLLLAWFLGELGHRWLALPRISSYGLIGIVIALGLKASRTFFEVEDLWSLTLLAQIAFGLLLFELGYRINLGWLGKNLWLSLSSLVEASATFAAVYYVGLFFDLKLVPALLLAALATATSPLTLLPVINELRSGGQVTERTLHLSAINCVLSIIAFNSIVGYWVLASAGNTFEAAWSSLVVVFVSAGLGVLFGVVLPRLLSLADANDKHSSVAFALAVAALILITHSLHFSPVLATLIFGLMARHHRDVRHQAQPNFGVLGDLLCIVLFVHIGSRLQPDTLVSGAVLAVAVLLTRFVVKSISVLLFSRLSGLSFKKGLLTSIALTPMASFAILLLELSAQRGLDFPNILAAMCGLLLLADLISPVILRRTLIWAGEASKVN